MKDIEQRCQKADGALKAIKERNRLLGDSTPLGIFTIDAQGVITGINRKMLSMFAWPSSDDPASMNIFDCRPLTASGIVADIQRCIAQNKPVVTERPYISPQGANIHLRCYFSPVPGSDDAVGGVMAIVEDYTDMKRTEEALRESEKRYRQLFQSAPIALIEWDVSHLKAYLEKLRASDVTNFREYLEGHPREVHHCWSLIKTVDYNQAFLKLMGVADSAGPSGDFIPTEAEGFLRMAREIILLAAAGNTAEEREETIVTTTGEPKIVLGKSLVVSGHEDTLERVAIAMVDISQRKKAEAALRESEQRFRDQALRDGLTGLYNQRYLYQSLAVWIDGAKNADTPISVIFMDLDHFKTIVDTHGHLNGSRAIQKVAGTIANCLQEPAFAVAYAGDEFVVVLPGMDQPRALQKASEIRASMKNTVYVLDQGIEVRLRASFGIATFPQHATDLNGLIAAADQALFAIKEAGKDAVGQFQNR
ncbi:MAG: sensor domain-containing diguanylate cyclase [Desulfosarcina sp.]|nr:sensor domain-containing diguanylate cyclase [Desulfosarcina sp.]